MFDASTPPYEEEILSPLPAENPPHGATLPRVRQVGFTRERLHGPRLPRTRRPHSLRQVYLTAARLKHGPLTCPGSSKAVRTSVIPKWRKARRTSSRGIQ